MDVYDWQTGDIYGEPDENPDEGEPEPDDSPDEGELY